MSPDEVNDLLRQTGRTAAMIATDPDGSEWYRYRGLVIEKTPNGGYWLRDDDGRAVVTKTLDGMCELIDDRAGDRLPEHEPPKRGRRVELLEDE